MVLLQKKYWDMDMQRDMDMDMVMDMEMMPDILKKLKKNPFGKVSLKEENKLMTYYLRRNKINYQS